MLDAPSKEMQMTTEKPRSDEEFQRYLMEIRELAQGPFDEMQVEIEVTNKFPQEFFDLANEHNLYRFYLPEKYGGWGMSTLQIMKVQEEFSRGPGGMRMHLHHAAGLNWRIMDDFAQKELKEWAMPRFQDKTLYVNFALTEKEAGSGADIKTAAVRDGDYRPEAIRARARERFGEKIFVSASLEFYEQALRSRTLNE